MSTRAPVGANKDIKGPSRGGNTKDLREAIPANFVKFGRNFQQYKVDIKKLFSLKFRSELSQIVGKSV